jgi:hypothetical protein
MIVKDIYTNPGLVSGFDFAKNGRETLDWLREMWQWNRDRRARSILDKFSRKFAAWKKKQEEDKKYKEDLRFVLNALNKLAREAA